MFSEIPESSAYELQSSGMWASDWTRRRVAVIAISASQLQAMDLLLEQCNYVLR